MHEAANFAMQVVVSRQLDMSARVQALQVVVTLAEFKPKVQLPPPPPP